MRQVVIGFSKPKNHPFPLYSWLIRLIGDTPYSHAYLKYKTGVGPVICYHAAHTFLHFLSMPAFEREIEVIEEFIFEISDEQYKKLLAYCFENCGVKYGLLEVFGLLIAQIFYLRKNPFGEKGRTQFCDELVMRALNEIGEGESDVDPDMLTLKELYDFVKKKSQSRS